jgi:hypothetical protein
MGFGRLELKCHSRHGRPCRLLRCSLSNGTKMGAEHVGIGSCFGEALADLSCSIRSAHFDATYGPTSVV